MKETKDVIIIGGADGPTSIFIAGHFNWLLIAAVLTGLAAGIAFLIVFAVRKRKK